MKRALKGNYWIPLSNSRDILDVACGTGRWAREMAIEFPQASVIGIDIVAPPGEYVPANYHFRWHDVFKRLPFASNSFDMVHIRLVSMAIPVQHWESLLRELVRVTRPKGWIELVEGSLLRFSHLWGNTAGILERWPKPTPSRCLKELAWHV